MRRDHAIVEGFLSAYNRHHGTSFKVARWADVLNRQTQAVEAVASNDAERSYGTTLESLAQLRNSNRLPISPSPIAQSDSII